jgi:hypothetical protein
VLQEEYITGSTSEIVLKNPAYPIKGWVKGLCQAPFWGGTKSDSTEVVDVAG